ncbi:MAG: selenium-dependent molybdenum cofactor biosynthesis protein YqeB [Chloroflexota bacterium]|nr:selenium-dependent molybdenum cofactor biosynthesis protein YqeB [Chloroflexota bacterium]
MIGKTLVMSRGAGDLASGVVWRLHRCGFPVVMTELPQPQVVRRRVAFAEAIFAGQATIEGVTAQRVGDPLDALDLINRGVIPVLVDPDGESRQSLQPSVVVDAIMAKVNTGTGLDDAPLVVALGPGFEAGVDCHAVIETNRGHNLGRVIWQGKAEPDTRIPGEVGGYRGARVLRAPADGHVDPLIVIGDRVSEGNLIARVDGMPVVAPFDGVLRGLVHESVHVRVGMKIGDLDARGEPGHCLSISDKSLAVGGGVLEAILAWLARATAKMDS